MVAGDRGEITLLALIVLDNVLKYMGEHSSVDVRLARNHHAAVFSIMNIGESIAPERLAKVFDRFQQIDLARACEPEETTQGILLSGMTGSSRFNTRLQYTIFKIYT